MEKPKGIDVVSFEKRAKHNFFTPQSGCSACMLYINKMLEVGEWSTEYLLSYSICKLDVFLVSQFDIMIGNQCYHPQYGDICILGPGELHSGRIPMTQHTEYFEFLFSPDILDFVNHGRDLIRCFTDRTYYSGNMIRLSEESRDEAIRLCQECREYMESTPARCSEALANLIKLLELIRHHYDMQYFVPSSEKLPDVVSRCVYYINERYAFIGGNEEIAEYAHVSVSYLTRMFKRSLGCTPYQYLIRRRLLCASQLLKQNASVTEACYESGFADCSHFIECFRRYIGMTPNQYKKSGVLSTDADV